VVRVLLESGADVNASGIGGETPLMTAVSSGNTDIIKLLLDAGSDVHAVNCVGNTALSKAGYVRFLKSRGSSWLPGTWWFFSAFFRRSENSISKLLREAITNTTK
jgi:hypothetical protein